MNSIYASLSLILSEIVLLLLIICIGVLFLKFRERRRDTQAIKALTEKLTSGREERLNVLSIKLKENLNLEGDELTAAAQEIVQKENDFYADVVKLYSTHDSSALTGLDQKVAVLAETYSRMGTTPAAESGAPPPSEVLEELTSLRNENARIQLELESLQETNEKLVEELEATRQEMRETVAEFVSAFSGGRDEAEKKMGNMSAVPGAKSATTEMESSATPPEEAPTEDTIPTPDTSTVEENEKPHATETEEATGPATIADETDPMETSDVEAEAVVEEGDNPFLNIGETPATTDDDDAKIDRIVNDLDSDLGLAPNETPSSTAPVTAPQPADDGELDSDDIEALLAENSGEAPAAEPEAPVAAAVAATEDELSTDDIDAILEGISDSEPESSAPAAESSGGAAEEEISADDIDAILEDIDIGAAETLSNDR